MHVIAPRIRDCLDSKCRGNEAVNTFYRDMFNGAPENPFYRLASMGGRARGSQERFLIKYSGV